MAEERQYNKILRLMTDTAKNLADLNDVLKSSFNDDLSEEEQKDLQLALLKLIVVIKEFGK